MMFNSHTQVTRYASHIYKANETWVSTYFKDVGYLCAYQPRLLAVGELVSTSQDWSLLIVSLFKDI